MNGCRPSTPSSQSAAGSYIPSHTIAVRQPSSQVIIHNRVAPLSACATFAYTGRSGLAGGPAATDGNGTPHWRVHWPAPSSGAPHPAQPVPVPRIAYRFRPGGIMVGNTAARRV